MPDLQPAMQRPRGFNPGAFLLRQWPYLLILALSLLGVAYSSVSKAPSAAYWIVLAPLVGILCVVTRWKDAETGEQRSRLIWTQMLHWAAVLVAMRLMFVADVSRIMNSDASALAALTVLALGTFTAGVHIGAWPICLVGIIQALGVPAIAWLEQSALLLLLVAVGLVAVAAPVLWHRTRRPNEEGKAQT